MNSSSPAYLMAASMTPQIPEQDVPEAYQEGDTKANKTIGLDHPSTDSDTVNLLNTYFISHAPHYLCEEKRQLQVDLLSFINKNRVSCLSSKDTLPLCGSVDSEQICICYDFFISKFLSRFFPKNND